jgi:DtxR family Mn-dependent transcriptional regulator
MAHPELRDYSLEETLELIWCRREEGDRSVSSLLLGSGEDATRAVLDLLVERKWIEIAQGEIALLPEGEERARAVVRRERLAERLLTDVLDVPLAESEHQACLLEHILSPAVTDRVCAFLGHPPTCPHGLPIPPGPCCRAKRNGALAPVVEPLSTMAPGKRGRIAFIAPAVVKRLDRLGSFGVVPGTEIVLRQKRPSFVIEVGGTTLALEGEVAAEIFVRPQES